ncbi:MAG: DUF3311 domain-containing protein [Pirellulales bacterium]
MKYLVWGLVVLLIVLHQDVWFWDDDRLVFGFMPITLLYHACISMGAGFTWFLATLFAWPLDEDELAQLAAASKAKHGAAAQDGGK